MVENIINKVVLQDELRFILKVKISHETQIKVHYLYKNIWTPWLGGHLEVQCRLQNCIDKYAVCNWVTVGHLKTENLCVLQRPHFIIYKVTLNRITQPKKLAKGLTLVMARVYKSLFIAIYCRKKVCINFKKTISFLKKNINFH